VSVIVSRVVVKRNGIILKLRWNYKREHGGVNTLTSSRMFLQTFNRKLNK